MATIVLKSKSLTGRTLTVELQALGSGTVVNTGGDALTETSNGHFAGTVAETLTGVHAVDVLDGSAVVFTGFANMSFDPAYIESPTQLGFTTSDAALLSGVSSGVTTLTTRIPGTVQPQTGDSYARLGVPSGASIASDINTVGLAVDGIQTDVDTLLGRIGSSLFTGITSLAHWLRALSRSDGSVNATAITEINSGSGGYNNTTDALQAIADNGGGGGGGEVTSFSESALQQLTNQGVIQVSQPLGADVTVTIVRGMDYQADDSRALYWTDTSAQWPDLTSATISVYAWNRGGFGRQVKSFTGSVIDPTGDTKQIRLELDSDDTSGMTAGDWTYGIKAVLNSGNIVDLVSPNKRWTVVEFPQGS